MMKRAFFLPLFACLPLVASAQSQAGQLPSTANDPFSINRPKDTDGPDSDPAKRYLQHRMEEARKVDRKKRMVDTAKRLLVLTEQLQKDLQGREATPEDQKRLDEIARLARTVKDQMRQ